MKFIVDAHLPRRLGLLLKQARHDTIHTLHLPLGNRTPDSMLNGLSVGEQRVLVTKDSDFVNSFLLRNDDLIAIFQANLALVVPGFEG